MRLYLQEHPSNQNPGSPTLTPAEIEPLAHPLELSARLRDDEVTETDQREVFQDIAPAVEAGLYLVPKVIE